jgi:pectate lyase
MVSATFSKIDNNQIATQRQVYGVACHFANIHSKTPSERYGLTKVFNAILNKSYKDSDSYMTHGEATEFFEWDCVPPQFLHQIKSVKKPKTAKSVKTSKKATAPKGKTASKKMTGGERLNVVEKRVDAMDSKLEKILEILSK